jgi:PAS domain S-box-containing protein
MTTPSTINIEDNNLLFEINSEGFCVKANKTVYTLTGYLPQEFIGKKFRDFLEIDGNYLNKIADKITTQEQLVVSFDCHIKHKSGNLIFVSWSMYWLAHNNIVTCIGKPFSASEHKLVEENLEMHLFNSIHECIQENKNKKELLDGVCKILLKSNKCNLIWFWEIEKHKKLSLIYKDSSFFISNEALVQTDFLKGLIEEHKLEKGLESLVLKDFKEGPHANILDTVRFSHCVLIPINGFGEDQIIAGIALEESGELLPHKIETLVKICLKLGKALGVLIGEEKLLINESSLNKYIRELNLLNEVNNQILTIKSEEELIRQILNTLILKGGYRISWITFFEKGKEKEKDILPLYIAGETEYAVDLKFDLNDPETLKGPAADCILTLKTSTLNSTQDDPNYGLWKEKAQKHGLASSISIYLDLEGNEKGVICIYSQRKNAFDYRETLILERLCHNLAYAINGLRNIKQSYQIKSTLKETKKILEDYRQALDQIAIISITDSLGLITYVNKNFEDNYGISNGQIIGESHSLISSGYHKVEFWADLWNTIKAGQVWTGEIKNIDKEGKERWYDTTIYGFTDSDNNPYQYMSLSWDITSQLAIKEKDKLITRIIESSQDAIYSVDLKGNICSWNEGAEKLFDYNASETIGKPVFDILSNEFFSSEKDISNAIINGNNIEQFETIVLRKNKEFVHVNMSVFPLRNEQNELIGYTKILRDINREKIAELRAEKFSTDLNLREKQFLLMEKLSDISKDHNISTNEILAQIVDLIPKSMQFSEIASAKIMHGNSTFVNIGFKESDNYITCSKHENTEASHLIIYYPDGIEFRNEEKLLIELVCNWTELISNTRAYSQSLNERIKEINLLIELNKIFNQDDTELDLLFESFTQKIPQAWHSPENTAVKIKYGNKVFYSHKFNTFYQSIEEDFETLDEKNGSIQVVLLENLNNGEDNFLEEEKNLLKAISINIQAKLDQLILRKNITNSEVRLNKIIDYSSTAYMLLNQNLDIIYSNKKSLEFGKTFYNLDLSKGKNIITDQNGEKSEDFELAFSKLDATNEIQFINEHIDKDGGIHVFEVRLFKTKNPKLKEFEIILIATDISHLKQREEDVNNLVNLLKELNFITSFEISHEFHKLQSIVELVQDLDMVDHDLKSIFSHSNETFKKANASIRKLIERINIPLKEEMAIANSLKRIEKIILLDDDEISNKISSKILEKFFDPIQIISFENVDDASSYFKSTGDSGNNIILLEVNLGKNDGNKFLESYISNKFNSPILLMGYSSEGQVQKVLSNYSFVKNYIQKPINKDTAEKIFTKKALVD